MVDVDRRSFLVVALTTAISLIPEREVAAKQQQEAIDMHILGKRVRIATLFTITIDDQKFTAQTTFYKGVAYPPNQVINGKQLKDYMQELHCDQQKGLLIQTTIGSIHISMQAMQKVIQDLISTKERIVRCDVPFTFHGNAAVKAVEATQNFFSIAASYVTGRNPPQQSLQPETVRIIFAKEQHTQKTP